MAHDNLKRLIFGRLDLVKQLMLTTNLVEILDTIKKHRTVTSCFISIEHEISIHNASTQLLKLYSKGYLEREKRISNSGGVEYIYEFII